MVNSNRTWSPTLIGLKPRARRLIPSPTRNLIHVLAQDPIHNHRALTFQESENLTINSMSPGRMGSSSANQMELNERQYRQINTYRGSHRSKSAPSKRPNMPARHQQQILRTALQPMRTKQKKMMPTSTKKTTNRVSMHLLKYPTTPSQSDQNPTSQYNQRHPVLAKKRQYQNPPQGNQNQNLDPPSAEPQHPVSLCPPTRRKQTTQIQNKDGETRPLEHTPSSTISSLNSKRSANKAR